MVDDETHVRLVDAHAEGNGSHNDIDFFHKELVLVFLTGLAVQTCMIRQGLDAVDGERFGQFFNLFAAEAIHDARFA